MTVEALRESFNVFDPNEALLPANGVRGALLPEPLYRVGIALPKKPLEGTPYFYQVGISSTTPNPSFVRWRELCPDLERVDGAISGVVVFDGDKVIAHYTSEGNQPRPPWNVGVDPEYRKGSTKNPGGGLAVLSILQWNKAAPWVKLVTWPVSIPAAESFVSAHRQYVESAIVQGEPVPQNVIDSVRA